MEIDYNNLHHAYLVLGNESDTENFIGMLFDKLKIKSQGNPDVIVWSEKKFGIDEARDLKSRSESKGFEGKKIFIINSLQITPEAQNALLKVFEEPKPDTHFFILSQRNTLLPTLNSRVSRVLLNSHISLTIRAKEFLNSNLPKRLEIIKIALDDESFVLADFLEELMVIIKASTNSHQELKEVYELSMYSNDPAANSRMILEHLALTLPTL